MLLLSECNKNATGEMHTIDTHSSLMPLAQPNQLILTGFLGHNYDELCTTKYICNFEQNTDTHKKFHQLKNPRLISMHS